MSQNHKISRRQFMAAAFCALLSPAIRTIPGLMVSITGEHAYISCLISIIPLVLLALLMQLFQRSLSPNEGMAELFIRVLGRFFGKALLLLFGLWMLFYSSFVLRNAAHRFISTIFPASSPLAYIPVMGVLLLITTLGHFKALCRMSGIIKPLLLLVLLLALLLSLPQVELTTFSIPVRHDLSGILLGCIPVVNALSIWGYLSFMEGYVREGRPKARDALGTLTITVLLLALLSFTTVGSFGPELAWRLSNPFFVMIRNIRLFSALERIEALVIALWFFTDFILSGVMLHAAVGVLSLVLGITIERDGFSPRQGRWLVWLCAIGCTVLATRLGVSTTALADLSMYIIPAANMLFMFILFPAVLIIGLLRKRI